MYDVAHGISIYIFLGSKHKYLFHSLSCSNLVYVDFATV